MTANKFLLQKKYARVIQEFSKEANISLDEAMEFFYSSLTYEEIREGISDMHCRSGKYLAEELMEELNSKI